MDNGTEFRSTHFDSWAYHREIMLDFIRPGRPIENAPSESFNGTVQDKCLNMHWFDDLDEEDRLVEAWRIDYNEVRSHSS